MNPENLRPYKVYAIREGVVIDHIPGGESFKVVRVLRANDGNTLLTMGVNFDSKKLVKKDLIKIENKNLTSEEIDKVSLIAPKATVSLIKDYEVYQKHRIQVPDKFVGLVRCINPNCITNHEPVITKFYTVEKDPLKIRCHHCERIFNRENIELL